MIDPRILRDDPDRVRAAQAKRGLSDAVVDVALAADAKRRAAIGEFEAKRAEQKTLGKQIPQAQGEEKQALLARTKELAAEVKAAEAAQIEAEEAWQAAVLSIPNLAHEDAPAGGEDDYVVLETIGTPRDFAAEGFEPRDHVELGRMLGAIDIERGAKVSGSRFYFLTGVGAQLELALVNLAMEQARNAGFTQVIAPSLVRPRAMEGTGFLGQAADDVYRIEGEDLYLVGTSEVPMAAYHSDEILDVAALPLRYAAFSPCFRKEAGSHGKDTKGIIRVHWFDKVEMFVYTTTEDSDAEHQRLLDVGEGVPRQARALLPRHRRRRRRPRPVGGPQVRLRGVDPDPGPLPRAHLDLQLHRVPDPPPRHPRPLPRGHQAALDAQRHPLRDHRARSWRSSRPTRTPTARSPSRRRCGRTWAGSRSSSRVHD